MWISIGIIILLFLSTIILNKRIGGKALDIFSVSFAWISWLGVTTLVLLAIFAWPLPMKMLKDTEDFNICQNLAYDNEYIYTDIWSPDQWFQVRRISDGSIVDSVKFADDEYPVQLCGFATNGKIRVFSLEGDYVKNSYTVVAVCGGKIIYCGRPFEGGYKEGSVYYGKLSDQFIATCMDRFTDGDSVIFKTVPADSAAIAKGSGVFIPGKSYHVNTDRDYRILPQYFYECDDQLYGLNSTRITKITLDEATDSLRADTLHLEKGAYDVNGMIVYGNYSAPSLYAFNCGDAVEMKFPAPFRASQHGYNMDPYVAPITYFGSGKCWQRQIRFYEESFDNSDSLPDNVLFMPSGILNSYMRYNGSFLHPGFHFDYKLTDSDGKEKMAFTFDEGYSDVFLEHHDSLIVFDHAYRRNAIFSMKDGHRVDFPGIFAVFNKWFDSNRGSDFIYIWLSLFLWPSILVFKIISDRKSGEKNNLRVYAWLYALMASIVLATMISNAWF